MAELNSRKRLFALGMAILGGSVYLFFATLSPLSWIFALLGLVLVFLAIPRWNLVVLSESSRRTLRLGMFAVGAALVAAGSLALLYGSSSEVRAYLPEAELFEGTFPSTPWGNFMRVAFHIGFPAGLMLLVLALIDHTNSLASRGPSRTEEEWDG